MTPSCMPRRRGRPRAADSRVVPLRVRIGLEERRRLEEAAALNRQTIAAFCRDAILTAIEDCLEDAAPIYVGQKIQRV